jgi:hypothetical protein
VFGLLRRPGADADSFVDAWKKAWIAGAHARWSTGGKNPYPEDPARAAWNAGHLWAADNPDRRRKDHMRLAHPLRRSTDTLPRVVRAVEIGALGFGVLAAARWAWRRRQRRNGDTEPLKLVTPLQTAKPIDVKPTAAESTEATDSDRGPS